MKVVNEMEKPSGTTVIYVAYVFFLLGFVSLGLFVAALAFGSSLVVWAGIALVGTFTLAVAAFRAGSSRVENIWADSVVSGEVDRYLSTYRRGELSCNGPKLPTAVDSFHTDTHAPVT